MKRFYHATPFKNLHSILEHGLKAGTDGITYLAETKEDACKFVSIRHFNEAVLVIEVELDETKVQETFDHSYKFFQCRAFGYPEQISLAEMVDFWKFSRK